MKLYWVTTEDHDEDWFIVASSPEEASKYHEDMEGYVPGDADATAFNEGARAVGAATLDLIRTQSKSKYMLMLTENHFLEEEK